MSRGTPVDRLNAHYRSLAARWAESDGGSNLGSLVTPSGNSSEPFHRWFHFKEAYSHGLLHRLAKDSGWEPKDRFSVYDPFAGSGTTLLSAIEMARRSEVDISVTGVELNPVMQVVAAAKVGASARPRVAEAALQSSLSTFWTAYEDYRASKDLSTPSVTLNNSKYFRQQDVRSLLALGLAAHEVKDPLARQILLACGAAAVEPSGRLRKDGRALRFSADKTPILPLEAFERMLARVFVDIQAAKGLTPADASVFLGDARENHFGGVHPDFSWAVFSPPYPNNIDYTEVYKTEAWAMSMYRDAQSLRDQRLATLRSHPSVLFPDLYAYESGPQNKAVASLLQPLLEVVPDDRYKRGRSQLIRGYTDDMLRVLAVTREVIGADGRAVVVVGNSAHAQGVQQFVVAADLLIAALAELSGWTVEEIRVARRPKRRLDRHEWLRESVISLRPQL